MLGDFITRLFLMLLGYAYPAFECFKTLEKNKVDIGELRFWCQYWIIVAILTVVERFGDIFISWLPMYGEIKLAFFIYLWYPKTKGSSYVYDTLLRPYLSKHETEIERRVQELRARAWDLFIFYWQHCTRMGHTTFFQVLQYLAAQSSKYTNIKTGEGNPHTVRTEEPPPTPSGSPSLHKLQTNQSSKKKNWPPSPPPMPSGTINRAVSEPEKPNVVKVQLNDQIEQVKTEVVLLPESPTTGSSTEVQINDKLQQARQRLRRSKLQQ